MAMVNAFPFAFLEDIVREELSTIIVLLKAMEP